jgi:hypothetical protein
MTRFGAVFWLVLVLAAGFTTFKVKYAVQDIEGELNRVRQQTIAEQQETRVLTAEWTYLNQPERLADLNRRFLALAPIAARQLQHSIADIPLRALPASPDVPAAAPDVVVAAAPDPAAPQLPAVGIPVAPAVLGSAPAMPQAIPSAIPSAIYGQAVLTGRPADAARVQLAKAGLVNALGNTPGSLDALIAQIADAR